MIIIRKGLMCLNDKLSNYLPRTLYLWAPVSWLLKPQVSVGLNVLLYIILQNLLLAKHLYTVCPRWVYQYCCSISQQEKDCAFNCTHQLKDAFINIKEYTHKFCTSIRIQQCSVSRKIKPGLQTRHTLTKTYCNTDRLNAATHRLSKP